MKKAICLAASHFALVFSSFAFVPETGQIARFQPQMRKTDKQPFLARGEIIISNRKVAYELRWFGPKSYQVSLHDVPSAFVSMSGTATGTWRLLRHDSQCTLVAGGSRYSCPPASFWAELELMGDPYTAPGSLVRAGIFDNNDALYRETNARDPRPSTADKRVGLAIGRNGNTPTAVIEIKGPAFRSDKEGTGLPYIHFDQTFLAPLTARFDHEQNIVSIIATSDLHVRRRYPRFQPIMSARLQFLKNDELRAELSRKTDEEIKSADIGKMQFVGGIASIESLRSGLSDQGENLLDFLLVTH